MKIKTSRSIIIAAILFSFAHIGIAKENDGEELLVKHRCYSCHHQTQSLIGPPYQAIAARHSANKKIMAQVLAEKIIIGGGGNWGVVPMVPNEHVSEKDAEVMSKWILNVNQNQ